MARRRILGGVVAVAIAMLGLAGCGGSSAEAVTLEPAAIPGPDPFSVSVQVGPAVQIPGNVQAITTATRNKLPTDPKTKTRVAAANTPGLYGGSGDTKVCDAQQLVTFLQENPDKAAAWAGVLDIPADQIATYVGGLTPVILTSDTLVTNHGFRDGRATSLQSVLEAGTAVMVDNTGTPRVKCNCGNPLTPPEPVATTNVRGTRWSAYDPANVTVVRGGDTITNITVINITTGDTYQQSLGGSGTGNSTAYQVTSTEGCPGGDEIRYIFFFKDFTGVVLENFGMYKGPVPSETPVHVELTPYAASVAKTQSIDLRFTASGEVGGTYTFDDGCLRTFRAKALGDMPPGFNFGAPGGATTTTTAAPASGAPSARNVDWMNHSYKDQACGHEGVVKFTNGVYEETRSQYDTCGNYIDAVDFADLSGDGLEEAIVTGHSGAGNSKPWFWTEVFGADETFVADLKGAAFPPYSAAGGITVWEPKLEAGDPLCCPSSQTKTTYTFDPSNGGLKAAGSTVVPTSQLPTR